MSNLALPAALAATLDDKYTATAGRVFLTGTQALIRLPMLQRERDLAAGLNTRNWARVRLTLPECVKYNLTRLPRGPRTDPRSYVQWCWLILARRGGYPYVRDQSRQE